MRNLYSLCLGGPRWSCIPKSFLTPDAVCAYAARKAGGLNLTILLQADRRWFEVGSADIFSCQFDRRVPTTKPTGVLNQDLVRVLQRRPQELSGLPRWVR